MNVNVPGVFRPGDGATPPLLAGRKAQQGVLSRCLADLLAGTAPPHNVVLLGPRGNGKTALLRWFQSVCEEAAVDVLALTPDGIADRQSLADALTPRRGLARWLPRKVGVASVASAEWQSATPAHTDLVRALTARCRRKPLAVLLDEAHTLSTDVGRVLLNASQQVRAAAPFLLVLAGTPGLPQRLAQMDASFWSRLGEGLLGVGRLDAAAARDALAKPLDEQGIAVEADVLETVVEHSQRYSYFIQLWGDALWRHLVGAGETSVAAATVEAVRPNVSARVADYYQTRYDELRDGGMLAAAMAVAPLFHDGLDATAEEHELDAALAAAGIGDDASRTQALRALTRLGYIWRPPAQTPPLAWSAGIPSLMGFVLEAGSRLGAAARGHRAACGSAG